MIKVCEITWLSKEALEAEVIVTDGKYELKCFSQPMNYGVDHQIENPIYCYNAKNILKSNENNFSINKLSEYFAYNITAQLFNKKNGLIKLGNIMLEIDKHILPGDVKENDYISLYCQRLDLI